MDNKDIHKMIKKRLHIREFDNLPYGSGRRYTRNNLAELYKELGFKRGAEIGVRRGRYSRILCNANPDLFLYCIDPWSGYSNKYTDQKQEKIYQEAVKNLKDLNVEIIRKSSMDALADLKNESLDFIFIDGNHQYDYVAPDIIYWSKKVKSGGVVSVHDYYSFGLSGVVEAVNGYVKSHHIDPWYVTKELEPTAYWVKP